MTPQHDKHDIDELMERAHREKIAMRYQLSFFTRYVGIGRSHQSPEEIFRKIISEGPKAFRDKVFDSRRGSMRGKDSVFVDFTLNGQAFGYHCLDGLIDHIHSAIMADDRFHMTQNDADIEISATVWPVDEAWGPEMTIVSDVYGTGMQRTFEPAGPRRAQIAFSPERIIDVPDFDTLIERLATTPAFDELLPTKHRRSPTNHEIALISLGAELAAAIEYLESNGEFACDTPITPDQSLSSIIRVAKPHLGTVEDLARAIVENRARDKRNL